MHNHSTIHLIRHEQPAFNTSVQVRGADFSASVDRYDRAGLAVLPTPSELTDVETVFSSDLPRALETAKAKFPDLAIQAMAVFREAQLTQLTRNPLRLSFSQLTVIARCLWMLGFADGVEPRRAAAERARQAAIILQNATSSGQTTALVGHGFFNMMIGRCLKRSGWQQIGTPGHAYGAVATYRIDSRG